MEKGYINQRMNGLTRANSELTYKDDFCYCLRGKMKLNSVGCQGSILNKTERSLESVLTFDYKRFIIFPNVRVIRFEIR